MFTNYLVLINAVLSLQSSAASLLLVSSGPAFSLILLFLVCLQFTFSWTVILERPDINTIKQIKTCYYISNSHMCTINVIPFKTPVRPKDPPTEDARHATPLSLSTTHELTLGPGKCVRMRAFSNSQCSTKNWPQERVCLLSVWKSHCSGFPIRRQK